MITRAWVDNDFYYKLAAIKKRLREKGVSTSIPKITKMMADKINPMDFNVNVEFLGERKRNRKVKGDFNFRL